MTATIEGKWANQSRARKVTTVVVKSYLSLAFNSRSKEMLNLALSKTRFIGAGTFMLTFVFIRMNICQHLS